jgi:hypothetical protein
VVLARSITQSQFGIRQGFVHGSLLTMINASRLLQIAGGRSEC